MEAQIAVTLTSTGHNGYNISCFGMQDGNVTAIVTGGTPPYTYQWSNQATTSSITNLAPGYYHIYVKDINSNIGEAEITLNQTEPFRVPSFSVSNYPNGKNVSCYYCFDGSIATSVETGIAPYTFEWTDGPTTQDRTNIFAGQYQVIVTDANGCTVSGQVTLTKPDRNDWTLNGNSGTNPATQYIGTSDSKDLVFKTNAIERLRLISNGDLKINSFTAKPGMLYVDTNGVLQSGFRNQATACIPNIYGWGTQPNLVYACPGQLVAIGGATVAPGSLLSVGGNAFFNGTIGIGSGATNTNTIITDNPDYKLVVDGKIGGREVNVKGAGAWPDYVFDKQYKLPELEDISSYIAQHHHLPDMPTAAEITKNGQALGELQRLQQQKIEELTLYIINLEERLRRLESKN